MKKILILITLICTYSIYAEPFSRITVINEVNAEKHGFEIKVNKLQKNGHQIQIWSKAVASNEEIFRYAVVQQLKNDELYLKIKPEIDINNRKKYFTFFVHKDNYNDTEIYITYQKLSEPIYDEKTNKRWHPSCGSPTIYKINLNTVKK